MDDKKKQPEMINQRDPGDEHKQTPGDPVKEEPKVKETPVYNLNNALDYEKELYELSKDLVEDQKKWNKRAYVISVISTIAFILFALFVVMYFIRTLAKLDV